MTTFSPVSGPPVPAPTAQSQAPVSSSSERASPPAGGIPALGREAVTPARDSSRSDRPTNPTPQDPPKNPPVLKGLNVEPLDTRLVGDQDKIPNPPPPPGSDIPTRLAEMTPTARQVDLRR
ncbi:MULTISPECIES: hypothetical protein [Paracoccaceae]|jgi:hypothetical protein|uniref:hypothetical protein n=1 Tax=Rhodobacterales TaxID=204455 RepID=UPI001D0ADA02|nr:hypothetical protein [Boseongicola sp. H5]